MKRNGITLVDPNETPSTALVIQRLSLVPEGQTENALERADHFLASVAEFVDGSEQLVTAAEQCVIDSAAQAQTADILQDNLKIEIKEWDERRLAVTRPIDDLKKFIADQPKPGIR